LDLVATFYGTDEVVGILDGKDGWDDVDLAAQYQSWIVKLAAGVAFRELSTGGLPQPLRLNLQVHFATSLFCYTFVHELESWRPELWQIIQKIASTPESLYPDFWTREVPFLLFIVKCFRRAPFTTSFTLPDSVEETSLGPYQEFLDHWEGTEAQVKSCFEDACDYHCEQMALSSPHDAMSVFSDSPFDFIPYEIFALLKLRELQGLPVPDLQHPLLELPTASRAPREIKVSNDPVFTQLEELYNRHCVNYD
jgi:hypothetical protein